MTLTVDLDEEQARQLAETAERLRVSVEDLARAAIGDLLARQDQSFERIIERVLQKNAELYRRLA